MNELKNEGFKVSLKPVGEGDVALVIRKDGTVEALIQSADESGREISADHDRLQTILALNLLLFQPELIAMARAEVLKMTDEAMKLRIVN